MAKILCKTKGNANPKGKPRVYFTCHPEDFEKYFEKICNDIFKSHDCAIYYTEDLEEVIEVQEQSTDLESNNLFVVPVTFKLLSEANRAMDSDILFAKEHHIPILPFMMESGIDTNYAQPEKFGELQYLNPFSNDETEVSYEEKLKNYLESVLISDEMAKRVRAAFDVYIFLSYRKKDRRYANELMRLIHSYPECWDVAIWFDEFLTPGESFRGNIEKALQNSKLFTLLVTPNLLEQPGGMPNYVMGEEYPAAKNAGVEIFPAEMEKTDRNALDQMYKGIPVCVNSGDEAFRSRFLEALAKVATTANDDDPMHKFLIGIAYLEGIDVEVNRSKGLQLVTSAAENHLPEAMEELYHRWRNGAGVKVDYREAAKWAKRLVDDYKKRYGQLHETTIAWENNLAITYGELGDYQKAMELKEQGYALCCRVFGEEHPDTLTALSNLACSYAYLGDYAKALQLEKKTYELRFRVLGEKHPDTLVSLNNLSNTCRKQADYKTALALTEKAYAIRCEVLGEEHPRTLTVLENLADVYEDLGDYKKSLELKSRVYHLSCQALGQKHPKTLNRMATMSSGYRDLGAYEKALELAMKAYTFFVEILGEKHPNTISTLGTLANIYGDLGEHKKAFTLNQKVYRFESNHFGEEHPATLTTLSNLAMNTDMLGNHEKALEMSETVYQLRCKVLGEEHPDSIRSLSNLATVYGEIGDYAVAKKMFEKAYVFVSKTLGKEHPDVIVILRNMAMLQKILGNYEEQAVTLKKLYDVQCKVWGAEDSRTIKTYDQFMVLCSSMNLCRHCGSSFKGVLRKKCVNCGREK